MEIPKRLPPKAETIKRLLLRSGNKCAFPNCNNPIYNDNNILVAQCCHIEAALSDGERFNKNQSNEDRRSYDNLLFLCYKHHIETDDVAIYDTPKMKEIKRNHEKQFSETPFQIHPNYVQQVLDTFNKFQKQFYDNTERLKRIESKVDKLKQSKTDLYTERKLNAFNYFKTPLIKYFFGRTEEISELTEVFNHYNTFQIAGVSGIGKSSFIAQFLGNLYKQKIFWIDCQNTDSKEEFLLQLASFLLVEFQDEQLKKLISESNYLTEEILKFLPSIIEKDNLSFVFDGINSKQHDLYSVFNTLNKNLKQTKLFYTTIEDIKSVQWSNPVYSLTLNGLDFESFCSLLKLSNVDTETNHFIRLYQLISGHPFLAKLVGSLLEYEPLESIVEEFRAHTIEEISDFIREKVFLKLDESELELIHFLGNLSIPFRYSLIKFLPFDNAKIIFKRIQKRYLIVQVNDDFFDAPDFIKSYINSKFSKSLKYSNAILKYLASIKSPEIFEYWAIIENAIYLDLLDFAEKITYSFFGNQMGKGNFELVKRLALELKDNEKVNSWWFIYYVLGRIHRFQDFYKEALEFYEKSFKYSTKNSEREKSLFEKAAILSYIERERGEMFSQEADKIYKKLSKSLDDSMVFHSKIALTSILLNRKEYSKCIEELENILSKNTSDFPINIIAGAWQTLGIAYDGLEEYQKAIDSFDQSFIYYEKALEESGMNAIDGLYNAYFHLGKTYANAGLNQDAAQIFSITVDLCRMYGLWTRYERTLFEFGYQLILIQDFQNACNVFSIHYDFIRKQNLFDKFNMIYFYKTYAFAHWYNEDYLDALQLIGIYKIEESQNNQRQSILSILDYHENNLEIDILDFFLKGALVLCLPKGKNFDDLSYWLSEVSRLKPELKEVMESFSIFQKPKE